MGLLQVPGAVGEAVDVPQGPGDDGGVGVAREEARLRLFARDGVTGVLEGAEQRGVPVEGDAGAVAGDFDGDIDSGDCGLRLGGGLPEDGLGGSAVDGRGQAHVHPQPAAVRHHIGLVAAGDLAEGDGGPAQHRVSVSGSGQKVPPGPGDQLPGGGDGVGPLFRSAGVGGDALDVDLQPQPALVGHLDLAAGGLQVHDPVVLAHQPAFDGLSDPRHVRLLVHSAQQSQGALELRPGLDGQGCLAEGGQGAGQARLHVAAAPAVDPALRLFRAQGVPGPAVPKDHRVHVAAQDQGGARQIAAQTGHQILPPRLNVLQGDLGAAA